MRRRETPRDPNGHTLAGLALAVLVVAVLVGCGFVPIGPDGPGAGEDVRVRVRNVSQVELRDVSVHFPDQVEAYGDLEPGGETSYRTVERAYRYAYVEADVEGRTLVLQPIDYVGESLLDAGRYTYEIGVDPSGDRLVLELVRD